MNDIGHIGEVARLLAGAVDSGGLALKHGGDEAGNNGGIGAVGVLAGAEDVEVTKANGFQAVGVGEGAAVVFAGKFGGGVGGFRQVGEGFDFAGDGLVAVGAAGRGVNDAANARLSGGVQNGDGAGDTSMVGIEREFDTTGHGSQGCFVEDDFYVFHAPHHSFGVGDVAFDDINLIAPRLQIFSMAQAEVIQHAHLTAFGNQGFHQMRTNKPAATCYQIYAHRASSKL